MWYSDPFLALPALWTGFAGISFGFGLAVKSKTMAILALVSGLNFVFLAALSYFFGYYLRHAEEINKWIGTI
jgi:hypothetical protein